jgi:hypothetical protein
LPGLDIILVSPPYYFARYYDEANVGQEQADNWERGRPARRRSTGALVECS